MGETQNYLLLNLEAPLMAFGGPMVDAIGRTARLPGQSQLAGLLGNALGYMHVQAADLSLLQDRLRFAALLVRPGSLLRDYQIVDLGRRHLVDTGWTTHGKREDRQGASGESTHIRERWLLADAQVLVALTLADDTSPNLDDLAVALDRPARPLFIGRKPCLPTCPLRLGDIVVAPHVEAALAEGLTRLGSDKVAGEFERDVRLTSEGDNDGMVEPRTDLRDWRNQMHNATREIVRTNWQGGGRP